MRQPNKTMLDMPDIDFQMGCKEIAATYTEIDPVDLDAIDAFVDRVNITLMEGAAFEVPALLLDEETIILGRYFGLEVDADSDEDEHAPYHAFRATDPDDNNSDTTTILVSLEDASEVLQPIATKPSLETVASAPDLQVIATEFTEDKDVSLSRIEQMYRKLLKIDKKSMVTRRVDWFLDTLNHYYALNGRGVIAEGSEVLVAKQHADATLWTYDDARDQEINGVFLGFGVLPHFDICSSSSGRSISFNDRQPKRLVMCMQTTDNSTIYMPVRSCSSLR